MLRMWSNSRLQGCLKLVANLGYFFTGINCILIRTCFYFHQYIEFDQNRSALHKSVLYDNRNSSLNTNHSLADHASFIVEG